MFNEISQIVGTPYENAIDSTAIKVRRLARGKKGAKTRPFAEALPPPKKLLADKAYDCAAFRDWLSPPVIPTKSIAANLILITSEPIGTATRSSACSAASKTHAASLPVTTNAPRISLAPSA